MSGPWERQPGESQPAFHAFQHYRDMYPRRSLDGAWQEHREQCQGRQRTGSEQAPGQWLKWNARWDWQLRVEAYDNHLDQQKRKKHLAAIEEAEKRHVQQAKLASQSLAAAIATLAKRIQKLRNNSQDLLDGLSDEELVGVVLQIARVMPELAKMERVGLGQPGDITKTEELRRYEYDITQRIEEYADAYRVVAGRSVLPGTASSDDP